MATLTHSTYGTGTLISEENGKATIQFNSGIKTLIVKFAKLTNQDGKAFEGATGDVQIEIKPANKFKSFGKTKEQKHAEKMSITAHSEYDRFELKNWYDEHQAEVKKTCKSW